MKCPKTFYLVDKSSFKGWQEPLTFHVQTPYWSKSSGLYRQVIIRYSISGMWTLLTSIQLFHAYLGKSQNYCPEVLWTARCTIAQGRGQWCIELSTVPRGSRFVYSAKQLWNNCFITQPMLKIPVFSPRNASFISTWRRYTQFTLWRSTSFSWCLTSSTRQQTKLLPAAFPLHLNGWRHRHGTVD